MIKIQGNYVIDADDRQYIFGELKIRNVTKDGKQTVQTQLAPIAYLTSLRAAMTHAIRYFQRREISAHDYDLPDALAKLDEIAGRIEKSVGAIREE